MSKAFLPVKIIDKQWADKLLTGSVYMRSLHEFGAWNRDKSESTKNSFRGDIHEGIIENIDVKKGNPTFDLFPQELKDVITNAWHIDVNHFQFLKIYCMYCLTYDLAVKQFEKPDGRLLDFGDTSVIIYNPDEFLARAVKSLANKYGDNVYFDMGNVCYFDINKDFSSFSDVFYKTKFYDWQKELRMVVGLLNGNFQIVNEIGQPLKPLIQSTSPLELQIGNIQDIAIAIPTKALVELDIPKTIGAPYAP